MTDVYRFVKDGKVGMLKSDATILYEAEYDDIDRNAFNTDFRMNRYASRMISFPGR